LIVTDEGDGFEVVDLLLVVGLSFEGGAVEGAKASER
jgi:hypothetical protein